MEQTVEREAVLGMGWRCPEGPCYHLAFLFCFHHFGLCLTCGDGGRKNRDGVAAVVGGRGAGRCR